MFNLKRPCGNCPFLAEGAIELRPGRLEGIVRNLLDDDRQWFICHKTAHGRLYRRGKHERQACVGALAYVYEHHGRLPVVFKVAIAQGAASIETLQDVLPLLRQP